MRSWFVSISLTGVFALLSSCAPTQPAQENRLEQASDARFESPYFEVAVSGNGPNVILVPGLASNAAVWDTTIQALEADFRLHAVQVSGFGGAPSRGNAENDNILDDLTADLVRYAAGLDGDVTMVGHSLGGLVTLKSAVHNNSPLDQIVIVDVLPFFSVMMDEEATVESIAPISQFMKATLIAQTDDVFAAKQGEALSVLVKREEDRAQALAWSVASDRKVMAQAMSEVLVTDLRTQMVDIQIPATIIFARDPLIANMNQVETFYRSLYEPIENATLIPIDGALHFVMLDQEVEFVSELRAILLTPPHS